MAELFGAYESDIQLAIQESKANLGQVSGTQGDQRRKLLEVTEASTDEGLEILDQMVLEVQNLPTNERASYNSKIRQYRSQIEESKERLKQYLDNEDRNELFGYRDSIGGDSGDIHDSQRRQLLNNNSSLERSSQRLRDSQRVAIETEGIGGNILNDLRSQRETITGARNTLMAADGYVDMSIQTLKSMTRRMTANKFISYAIIAVLILLIFMVLVSKFS